MLLVPKFCVPVSAEPFRPSRPDSVAVFPAGNKYHLPSARLLYYALFEVLKTNPAFLMFRPQEKILIVPSLQEIRYVTLAFGELFDFSRYLL